MKTFLTLFALIIISFNTMGQNNKRPINSTKIKLCGTKN